MKVGKKFYNPTKMSYRIQLHENSAHVISCQEMQMKAKRAVQTYEGSMI